MASSRQTIVCGVDGSPESADALVVAGEIAQRTSAELVLVHAVEPAVVAAAALGYRTLGPSFDLTLEAGRKLLHDAALEVTTTEPRLRVAVGPPVQALIDVAEDEDAVLLVVGSRGRGALATALLGSTSAALSSAAPCPVVVVPPEAKRLGEGPVLCAVDVSEQAVPAVLIAAELALALGNELALAHVAGTQAPTRPTAAPLMVELERKRAEHVLAEVAVMAQLGANVSRIVLFGEVAQEVAAAAQELGASLVVTGSRGLGPLAGALRDSKSSRLRSRAACAVSVVPPAAAAGRRPKNTSIEAD